MPIPAQRIELLGLSGEIIGEIDVSKARLLRQFDPELRESLEHGASALARINQHQTFSDWMLVGAALAARQKAARLHANGETSGANYNRALEVIDASYPDLAAVAKDRAVTNKAIWMAENREKILLLYNSYTPNVKQRINHPNTVYNHFKKKLSGASDSSDNSAPAPGSLRAKLLEKDQELDDLNEEFDELRVNYDDQTEQLEKLIWVLSSPKIKAIISDPQEQEQNPDFREAIKIIVEWYSKSTADDGSEDDEFNADDSGETADDSD